MRNRLPPLPALRAFEAAGRHLNYSRAAEELFVTHAAISHHIKSLENAVGLKLFQRIGRQMRLTESGSALHAHVSDAFERLRYGVNAVCARGNTTLLNVSVLPAFAARWLVPRIPMFETCHPDIDLVLRATSALADFSDVDLDVAIRFGLGKWPGVLAERMMEENVFPVCSPKYRHRHLTRSPKDLLKCALLHDLYQPWDDWFRSVGIQPPKTLRGPRFNESNSLLRAAVEGHGVALALATHVDSELRSGELVACQASVRTKFAYYFVTRRARELPPKIQRFRDWLFGQVNNEMRRSGMRQPSFGNSLQNL